MNVTTDKSLIALIIGPIIGLLVMKGYIAPDNANQIQQLADTVIGGLIALFTIIGYFMHHTAVQTSKNQSQTQVTLSQTTTTPQPSDFIPPANSPVQTTPWQI